MNKMRLFARAALLAGCLCLARPAACDDGAALAEAQRLLAEKNYAALRLTLAPLLASPEPHLEALFLSGLAAAGEADWAAAVAAFRAMLARDPGLVRPRLELARALQKSGQPQAARYHYDQVLAGKLPEPVVANIYRQLAEIRSREPTLRLTLELSSDSNPRQTTDSRVIYIGGLPYRLNNGGRAETVYGLAASADLHWPLAGDSGWYGHAYGEVFEYPGQALDSAYVQASLGRRFERGQHHLSLEAGGLGAWHQGRTQYTGGLLRVHGFYRATPRMGATASAQVRSLDYSTLPYLDGEQPELNLGVIFIPAPAQRLELGLGYARYRAAENAYSWRRPSLIARYAHELPGGWIAGLRLQTQLTRYAAPDPFFGARRTDDESRLEFDVLNRRLKWWSFSPRAIVGYVKRDSNLDLYSYDRTYGRIGLTREF